MIRLLKDWGVALAVGVAIFYAANMLSQGSGPARGMAPPFTLVNAEGGTTSLAEYQGKTVVLNFWGSWCSPCRAEIPEFASWAADHPDVPVLGIAVRSGEGAQLAENTRRLGVNYPVLESTSEVLDAYGVDGYPTTVVIDGDGQIVSSRSGRMGRSELDTLVAAATPKPSGP